MRNRSAHWAVSAAVVLASASAAAAQPAVFNPYPPIPHPVTANQQQPLISPFLGLLQGGNAAVNYFLTVEPGLQRQNQLTQPLIANPNLNPQLTQQQKDQDLINTLGRGPLGQTGHPTSFSVYYGYRLPARGYVPYTPRPGNP